MFLEAAKSNGLFGDDLKPWHLRVSYKLVDGAGQPTDQGTIDELWAGPKLGKLVITSATSKLVYLQTQEGFYREGEVNEKLALLALLTRAFADPMRFSDKSLKYLDVTRQERMIGSLQLRCFSVRVRGGVSRGIFSPTYDDPAYCVEHNSPILQIDSFADDAHRFILYHTGRFQGRYVPMDVTAAITDKPDLTAHLEVLEQIPHVDPADFEPGPNAVLQHPAKTTLVIPGEMLDGMFATRHLRPISQPRPEYPAAAKLSDVHGTVKMRALVGTDGHIAALRVIEGPEALREAALDAAWRWRFEEPFDDARHIQILTVISMRF